jgi:hypothetical protein
MMTTEQPARAVTSRDLWAAVDQLLKPSAADQDMAFAAGVRPPSLWVMLLESVEPGQGEPGRGVPGSRPPLDVGALGVLLTISNTVGLACRVAGLTRTFDFGTDLRAVVRAVSESGDPDVMFQWHRALVSWCQRIRTVCLNDVNRPRRIRGACRKCGVSSVRERGADGVVMNQLALVVTFRDGLMRAVVCASCGATWWRGSSMMGLRPGRRVDNGH